MDNYQIVIPVYNALDCIQFVLNQLDEHYPQRKLILVDDCSQEPTRQFLMDYSKKENTELVQRQRRGWFTRAINSGLRQALNKNGDCPEWLITLNSDCELGQGAFEEMFEVWKLSEPAGPVGLVGADGPKAHCPRMVSIKEPGYVTGHCFLLSTKLLREQNLLFPWLTGQVNGFTTNDLVHIASDRALCWEMNRRNLQTVVSYHCAVGHRGGRSWGYNLHAIPPANQVGED